MTSSAFARYLPQFPVTRPGDLVAGNEILLFATATKSKEPVPDIVAEAEERGRREATEAAQAAADHARAEAEVGFERRMGQERRRWTEVQADRLAGGITAALHDLETRLAAGAARALVPFLEAIIRQRAIDDLARTLHEILADSRNTGLTITGPEDLLAMVRDRLGGYAGAVSYVVDEAADIRVACDDTSIETQFRAWTERLRQAVAET
jgi:hypothetical protein